MNRRKVCLLLACSAALALAQDTQPPAQTRQTGQTGQPGHTGQPGQTGKPVWMQSKIAEYKRLPPFRPPRSVVATLHEGRNVYYVSSACCDIPSELYDEQGTLLCYPDGGFAGGDGRCRSFCLVVTQSRRYGKTSGPLANRRLVRLKTSDEPHAGPPATARW